MYLVQMIGPFAVSANSCLIATRGSTTRIQALLQTHEEDRLINGLDIGDQTLQMFTSVFSYDQHHPILSDVSFTAEPNWSLPCRTIRRWQINHFSLIERFANLTRAASRLAIPILLIFNLPIGASKSAWSAKTLRSCLERFVTI